MIFNKGQLDAFEALCDAIGPEQRELIVLFGAELFKKGLFRGAIYGSTGAIISGVIAKVIKAIKKNKKATK